MSGSHHNKIAATILGWFASWKIGEVQALVGVLSGLVVAGYAGTQWFFLVRDRIKGKAPKRRSGA